MSMSILKNSLLFILFPLVFIRCTPSKSSAEKLPEKITVDGIIQKYYTAIGGYDKLKRIGTMVKKGSYTEPAYKLVLSAQLRQKRPGYRVVGDVKLGYAEGISTSDTT